MVSGECKSLHGRRKSLLREELRGEEEIKNSIIVVEVNWSQLYQQEGN